MNAKPFTKEAMESAREAPYADPSPWTGSCGNPGYRRGLHSMRLLVLLFLKVMAAAGVPCMCSSVLKRRLAFHAFVLLLLSGGWHSMCLFFGY